MNILGDFKALLAKGNALALAVGVAIGMAVAEFAGQIVRTLINPLLTMITGGGEGITKLDTKYLKFGSLLEVIIDFAVVLAVIYAIFVILLPMLFGKSDDEQTPPPAPPV